MTTIDIHDDLLARAKRHARSAGIPLRAVVEDGLRVVLDATGSAESYHLPDLSVVTNRRIWRDWCDQSFAGQVSLTGSARRELNGAEFLNVGLAARCLSWLGREYRDGRLRGGAPDLHGRIGLPLKEKRRSWPCTTRRIRAAS